MADRVRVGVIGTGAIAMLRHLPAFATSAAKGAAEIVADANPFRWLGELTLMT